MAVRSSARRIAEENNWTLGKEVGYQIRFEKKHSSETKIVVVTEGVLTRWMIQDPFLNDFSCVLLDEFHERNIYSDFAISWLKQLINGARKDLFLVIMSATMDAGLLKNYLSEAKIIEAKGQLFPLDIRFLDRPLSFLNPVSFYEQVAKKVESVISISDYTGHLLVFLPGIGEINRLFELLNSNSKLKNIDIFKLHSKLNSRDQDRVLRTENKRKIILTTNIAETSLTVEGVNLVIDTGLEKVITFDTHSGCDSLNLKRVSVASADQRAGRAARQSAGICFRLWTEKEHDGLKSYLDPEIKRVDITESILSILKLLSFSNTTLRDWPWLSNPREEQMEYSLRCLKLIRAINEKGGLTRLGELICQIPAHPKLATLLLHGKKAGCLREAALIAALLNEGDFLKLDPRNYHELDALHCDISIRLHIFKDIEKWSYHEVSEDKWDRISAVADHFVKSVFKFNPDKIPALPYFKNKQDRVLQLLLLSFADGLTRLRSKNKSKGLMVGGRGVQISKQCCLKKSELFLSLNLMQTGRNRNKESSVSLVSKVNPQWVKYYFADLVLQRTWQEERKKEEPKAYSALSFFEVPLENPVRIALSSEIQISNIVDTILKTWKNYLTGHPKIKQWVNRVNLCSKYYSALNWPDFNQESLTEIVTLAFEEQTEWQKWSDNFLLPYFELLLPFECSDLLTKMAPPSIKLPNQKTYPLHYKSDGTVCVRIIIKDLYGMEFEKKLMEGRVPLQIEVLGPNQRLIQTTSSLKKFWQSSYPMVRKDYRGRYPKHPWPEDPLSTKHQ